MIGSVERYANEKERDGEHEDTDKNVHLYSLPISSIRRWICRWSRKIPQPSKTAVAMASHRSPADAVPTADTSHPRRLISATTTIPSQSLR